MSALIALFHRDGAPLEPLALEPLTARLAHRGPDGGRSVVEPPFALAHLHFRATPADSGGGQPLAAAGGRRLLLFDGRLDNRDELVRDLDGPELATASDAALVRAAFEHWGEACLPRLVGPFALLLADVERGSLLCARDPLGDRTLFYHLDGRRLLVASEEDALLAHPEVGDDLDEDRLAHFFAVRVPADGSTFFAQVRELRPGRALEVSREGHREWRYWRPRPRPVAAGLADAEFAELFLGVLRESVSCRLRGAERPAVMMSGGLDSTTIAALAAGVGAGASAVRAVSWVFDELASCDERAWMDPVVERCGLEPIRVPGDDAWPRCDAAADFRTPEESPYRELKRRVYSAAAAAGSRVVLNGGSADLLYAGAEGWLRDLAREGRGREAMAELAEARRAAGWRGLARALRAALAPRAPRRPPPDWLQPAAFDRVRDSPALPDDLGVPWLRPRQAEALLGAREARSISLESAHAHRAGVDLRHPYRDRRLVELALGLPTRQLFRRQRHKHVARLAAAGLLPEAVLRPRPPTLLTPLFRRGVGERSRDRVRSLLFAPGARWPAYVRPDRLGDLERAAERRPIEDVLLWSCVSFELWLKARAARAGGGAA